MIAIPNMDMPETCDMCPIEGCEYINGKFTCPLIDIVTCGECAEWHEYARQNKGRCDCWFITTDADDFCSYGERRSDEHNNQRD